jgi:hypothetical protein
MAVRPENEQEAPTSMRGRNNLACTDAIYDVVVHVTCTRCLSLTDAYLLHAYEWQPSFRPMFAYMIF